MAKQGRARILTEQEHQEMLTFLAQTAYPERNLALYLIGYRTGMRVASIAGLQLSDVFDQSGKLKEVVNLSKSIVKGGKNYAVYLTHEEVREAIHNYVSIRPNRASQSALFLNNRGEPFSANSLSQLFLKLFRRAGFEGASSHSNRRSFATRAIQKGVDIVAVKTLMNHSNISTTAIYCEHNEEFLKKAVSCI